MPIETGRGIAWLNLEARFGDRIAVIGGHSPKFAAERHIDKLAAAIARYGITHPVAHDPDFTIWRQYARSRTG